jgi:hypothetical protein
MAIHRREGRQGNATGGSGVGLGCVRGGSVRPARGVYETRQDKTRGASCVVFWKLEVPTYLLLLFRSFFAFAFLAWYLLLAARPCRKQNKTKSREGHKKKHDVFPPLVCLIAFLGVVSFGIWQSFGVYIYNSPRPLTWCVTSTTWCVLLTGAWKGYDRQCTFYIL